MATNTAVANTAATNWPEQYREFRYSGLRISNYRAMFEYELVGSLNDTNDTLRFTETIEFPPPPTTPDAATTEAFTRVVELLYLVAGVSYYKVAAPEQVVVTAVSVPPPVESYLRSVYTHGLGEFAYVNNLPRALRPSFTVATAAPATPPQAALPGKTPLVTVGGGKDSIISVELLRGAGHQSVLFSVNPNHVMRDVIDASGLPSMSATRRIDPQLLQCNTRGAYNGHIPVTAINSAIAVATSVLHGLGPVVMSNERSASSGNLTWHGDEINHQWSKSLDAERQLAAVLATLLGPGPRYFSLLRPLSELHIAKIFAETTTYDNTSYDSVFTSCNAVFRLTNPAAAWCGDCPKCRFIFLALAPFMTVERLTGIFGKNMLADLDQLPGYRELTGVAGQKPFECVGEIDESLVALGMLAEHPDWGGQPVVKQLLAETAPAATPELANTRTGVFTPSAEHLIPAEYRTVLPCG